MNRAIALCLILMLAACLPPPEPGTQWATIAGDFKVRDSLAAILIAQEVCQGDIAGLTGRERQDFFDDQRKYGWQAAFSNGEWVAGVAPPPPGHVECPHMGARIDARTGQAGSCLQCFTIG